MSRVEHQARIDQIQNAEKGNKQYFRRIRIRDYMPGQAIYNLGDYPAHVKAAPTDYDRALIKEMAARGVELIQVHEDWNDAVRLYGADKFNAPDPEGMKDFIRLCHEYGIKIIAYVSSGYFPQDDPDYREEFSRIPKISAQNYFKYRRGHHGNAAWRDYVIPKTLEVMDKYGFDGIFNDYGYDGYVGDHIPPEYDHELEDMLSIIYSEIKRRGGIYKLHCDRNNAPACKDRVYDYLWIGEWVENSPIGAGKEYPTYVVPCQDRHRSDDMTLETYMAYTLPFLQFPLLKMGRPIQGNNIDLPGVTYYGGDEYGFYKDVGEYMRKNPEGPYVYSLWSSIPDDVTEFDVWSKYLDLYRPMVKENSLAYIELRECDEIISSLPEKVYASMFVNEETYLMASNLTDAPYELKLSAKWRNRVTGEVSDSFIIDPEKLCFLVKEN